MRNKRFIIKLGVLVLGSSMLLGGLAGCAKKEEAQVSGQNNEDSDRVELEFWTRNIEKFENKPWLIQEIENKYDINMKFVPMPVDTREYVNLQIASGDIPEMLRDFPMQDYYSYIDQGILAEIPREMIEENAPRTVKWFEENVGMDPEVAWKYYERNGKNYSIPILWTLGVDGYGLGIREDMFNAVGMAQLPTTLDELEEGMIKIKEKFNIYPLGGTLGALNFVFGAYDVYPRAFTENRDGKITYGIEEPAAKDALEVLNRWYELGLIDPEFMINTGTVMEDKFKQGKTAVMQYYWWPFTKEEIFGSDWHEVLESNSPGAKITVLPFPKGENGYSGTVQDGGIPSSGFQFGKQLEEDPEKMAKYLQVFDELSFTQEMLDMQNLGVEGEHYNYTQENGVEWIAPYDQKEEREKLGIGIQIFPGCFNDYGLQTKYQTHPQFLEERKEIEHIGTGRFDLLSALYRPIWNQKSESLEKMATTAFIDFITGKRPINDYDKFVKEWLNAGGAEVLEEAQQVYDELSK